MIFKLDPRRVAGLLPEDIGILADLLRIYEKHRAANNEKEKYYEGKVSLRDVNLGIALPDGLSRLEIGCAWGAKCVDVLAARSMFDGFVGTDGEDVEQLNNIVTANRLVAEYMKAARDELKFGCDFATLSADPKIGCKIRFHSPKTAAASWDGNKGRIAYGMAIIDTAPDNTTDESWTPALINVYTDRAIIVLHRVDSNWSAEYYPHRMGRPLMEPLVWNATSDKPFGRSRIKEPVRRLIQGYVRMLR